MMAVTITKYGIIIKLPIIVMMGILKARDAIVTKQCGQHFFWRAERLKVMIYIKKLKHGDTETRGQIPNTGTDTIKRFPFRVSLAGEFTKILFLSIQ